MPLTTSEARARAASDARRILSESALRWEAGTERVLERIVALDQALLGMVESGCAPESEAEMEGMSRVGEALGALLHALRNQAELATAWSNNIIVGLNGVQHG